MKSIAIKALAVGALGALCCGTSANASTSGRGTAKMITQNSSKLEFIQLFNPTTGQEASIYMRGAQVFSWTGKNADNVTEEYIWQNTLLPANNTVAYQAGIPVIFPQFADFGPVMFHGFAQVTLFELLWTKSNINGEVTVALGMSNKDVNVLDKALTADPSNIYTDPFQFEYIITLDNQGGLNSTMRVVNVAHDQDLSFTTAFHNYLEVSDINNIRVGQLEGLSYADRMNHQKMVIGETDFDTMYGKPIHEHTDRVYTNTPALTNITVFKSGTIDESNIEKVITIEREGFDTVTLWNPYGTANDTFLDWEHFIAVESGCVVPGKTLQPGEEFVGSQRIAVSYSNN
mmetsp:Transcript_1093/g.1774  ORF Transcript_1093/g.1774 Transcript_1093/m.1774 type:complete len:345 (+) Transcript_1093:531-1565(+)|eukprot:CAMPEP_0203784494 /NCGR_PEP_ID=MMETSP0100_2-20121128/494_1 /ASSEMBLY_ACC=CAM_ASM_000210 /TAXON_ID=96639 /ORGANISM=" , Strain NY0313808BC1" /LENGTH=344 /DNA_ID=CAMNT_0050686475 /DNA_START=473 /DNA_END=1510 /DNA_ORIENTATION=-